jgi:hypothetical protein
MAARKVAGKESKASGASPHGASPPCEALARSGQACFGRNQTATAPISTQLTAVLMGWANLIDRANLSVPALNLWSAAPQFQVCHAADRASTHVRSRPVSVRVTFSSAIAAASIVR